MKVISERPLHFADKISILQYFKSPGGKSLQAAIGLVVPASRRTL
jgi:hypothetical protein